MMGIPPAIPTPLIGAHFSIARGLERALYDAMAHGCTTCQIFTKNAMVWRERELSDDRISSFRQAVGKTGIREIASHGSYLINLASPEPQKHAQSCQALENELYRSDALGIPYVVLHPGAHMGEGETVGMRRVIQSINGVVERTPEIRTRLLLETTSGQGSGLGHRFEQLAAMLAGITDRHRVGICLDSCHIFAAGYDIRTETHFEDTMMQFESTVGLGNLFCIHLNDSKRPLGSKVDRHEHIGSGHIGLTGFECFMRDPRLEQVPKIIETPKSREENWDRTNLERLRQLAIDQGKDCLR